MARLIEVERKSDVLTHPALKCLSHYHTINLTTGCPYECKYCYARSFRSNPGPGKVHFYTNTFELLRRKLPNKRKKPELVYFSTACEPFAPFPQVLASLYSVMELLLEHGVSLLISTKSSPPERFLDLFVKYPDQVYFQMGLTTVNDNVRKLLEPHASCIESRVHALRNCLERGIRIEARCDPLIPELTDTEESFEALCRTLLQCGITDAAASYLFLRHGNMQSMDFSTEQWSFHRMKQRIYNHRITNYCGNNEIRIASSEYRLNSFNKLRGIAQDFGIYLRFCRCKNPDITAESCHPKPVNKNEILQQATLFHNGNSRHV